MSADALVVARRQRWARLGELVGRGQARGAESLAPEDVREAARLYRETAADLARLRTAGAAPEIEDYVERLVAGGHNLLYRSRAEGPGAPGVVAFLVREFPTLVRRSGGALALAALLWAVAAAGAFTGATLRPDVARDVCPQRFLDRIEVAAANRALGLPATYISMDGAFVPVFSGTVIANNVQATFVAFALGVTAGFGTAAVLLLNGALFGLLAGVYGNEGVPDVFWAFVGTHGWVEIPAFLIAAAAGLRLGGALLRPGERTRRDALAAEAVDAGRLLGGTTVLLVLAGVVEGAVAPLPVSPLLRVGTGLAIGLLVGAWLLLGGRGGAEGEGPVDPALDDVAHGPASVLGPARRG